MAHDLYLLLLLNSKYTRCIFTVKSESVVRQYTVEQQIQNYRFQLIAIYFTNMILF